MNELALREILESEKSAALARVNRLNSELNEIVGDADDDGKQYSLRRFVHYERERIAGLLEDALSYVADIEHALARLASGTFGLCRKCGGTIPEERLIAFPTSGMCVECAAVRR